MEKIRYKLEGLSAAGAEAIRRTEAIKEEDADD